MSRNLLPMREERAASESARCGCGRKASGTAVGDRFMEAKLCAAAAAWLPWGGRGRSRSSRGREVRHGGRVPAGQGTTRSERNRSGRPFTGKDAAGMTPNARRGPRDRRCPVGRRRRGGSKRRAPVAPWLPRVGRGAVPCARCRQGTEPEKSVRPVWHNFRKPRTMVDSARSGSSVG